MSAVAVSPREPKHGLSLNMGDWPVFVLVERGKVQNTAVYSELKIDSLQKSCNRPCQGTHTKPQINHCFVGPLNVQKMPATSCAALELSIGHSLAPATAGEVRVRQFDHRLCSRQQEFCQFAGTPSPSLLKRLRKGEGGAAE